MRTGKVEYAPDYKSGRRTLTIAADIPDDVDDRLLFCDSTQERIAEHQRLQAAVVEAAKARRKINLSKPKGAGTYLKRNRRPMTIPRIDPSIKHCGVSELRKLNASRLREMPPAIVIQENDEPIAVIVSYETFLLMQSKIGVDHA
jgi:hypothetical protein